MLPTLAFIGAGRVANALAIRFFAQGYSIRGIYSRRYESAATLAVRVESQAVSAPPEADLIMLTVPDDALRQVVKMLAAQNSQGSVVHTSGVHSLNILSALAPRPLGSFHPMYPFREGTQLKGDEGMLVGIEASNATLAKQLFGLAHALGGQPALLKTGEKARYHAGAAIASNYLVTLFDIGFRLLKQAGVPESDAREALLKLMQGNLDNLEQVAPAQALTGPIARGDLATVQQHLNALQNTPYAALYRELGQLTAELAPNLSDLVRQELLEALK